MPQKIKIDLTNKRFGRWTVILENKKVHDTKAQTHPSLWYCVCDCGEVRPEVLYSSLVSGRSKSCGCLRKEFNRVAPKMRHKYVPCSLDDV